MDQNPDCKPVPNILTAIMIITAKLTLKRKKKESGGQIQRMKNKEDSD